MKDLNKFLDEIENFSNPVSIFLYGSRARNDYLENSDYEIGILYESDKFIDERTLHSLVPHNKKYRFYPYEINSFIRGSLDIPFESSIFLRMISLKGRTLRGKSIVENFLPPHITVVSLMREIKFQIGRASDSIMLLRLGEDRLGAELFFKSCLWGTRDLIILLKNQFPVSYIDINESSKELDLEVFQGIVNYAYEARISGKVADSNLISNIWYLNRFVEKRILKEYQNFGDKILIF